MIALKINQDQEENQNGLSEDSENNGNSQEKSQFAIKKKIKKIKADTKNDKKINSNTHFSPKKILSCSETNHSHNDVEKKIDSDSLLKILKNLASDPERYKDTSDPGKALHLINQYKTENHKIVFTDLIFNGVDGSTITPLIFTKKNPPIKQPKPLSPHILAFENYLHLITQMYYKKNFNLLESISNYEGSIKEASRPGRKAKNRPVAPEENSMAGNHEEIGEGLKQDNNSITKDLQLINFNQDILNSLVSPLRKDLIFEKWGPKEIAIFEGALCKYGKQFLFINHLIPSKTFNEIIEFYQAWKQTSHYKIWKYYKNLGNRSNFNHWL